MSTAFVQPAGIRGNRAPQGPAQVCGRNQEGFAGPVRFTICAEDKKKPSSKQSAKGLFGRLKDTILRPIVAVPGGNTDGDLFECVFCKGGGFSQCDSCLGTGKDALGTCFMCDGVSTVKCTVCNGVGMVDRIRRGGTDDRNEYTFKKKRK